MQRNVKIDKIFKFNDLSSPKCRKNIIKMTSSSSVSAWILGWWMCKFFSYVQGVSVVASVYSLIAVSLDR